MSGDKVVFDDGDGDNDDDDDETNQRPKSFASATFCSPGKHIAIGQGVLL